MTGGLMKAKLIIAALMLASLCIISIAEDVTLAWDAPEEFTDNTPIDVAISYRLLTGTRSGDYSETNEMAETQYVMDVPANQWHYSVVLAVTEFGQVSDPSNELKWAYGKKPKPPSKLRQLLEVIVGWFKWGNLRVTA